MPAIPEVDGSNWKVDQPYTHNRYSFDAGEWVFVVRDVGTSSLWRLHAKSKVTGEVRTYGLDNNGASQDGLQPLYGAAVRMVLGRLTINDFWMLEEYPALFDNLFVGLLD